MFLKLAIRNLLRNRWRTGLTMGGIAVATAMLVWTLGWFETFNVALVRGATAVDVGQVQVQGEDYVDEPSLYHNFPVSNNLLDVLHQVRGVAGAAPRAYAFGLVGNEQRSQVARLIGIDPRREREVTRLADGVVAGGWFSDEPMRDGPREALLGATFAQQLGVAPGAELVVFLQAADGSLGNELLRVQGVVKTGNTNLDRNTVLMRLEDVQYMAALDGKAHEISLSVEDFRETERIRDDVQQVLATQSKEPGAPHLRARTWKQVVPHMAQMIEVNEKSVWVVYIIIYLIAGMGILNTMRMSAHERRREFGVLLAVGLKPRQLAAMIVAETVLLSVIGGLLGGLLGMAVSAYHAAHGLDTTVFTDQGGFSYLGIAFDERMYFVPRLSHLVTPVLVVAGVGVLCGLWPAIKSSRLDAIRTIAGRT